LGEPNATKSKSGLAAAMRRAISSWSPSGGVPSGGE